MTEKRMTSEENWDLVITPKAALLDFNLKEVWRYRDLMMLFIKRDFIAQYKQTILGPFWHLIQPVLTTVMFLMVFGRIARIPTDGIPPVLFYMTGITFWNYFSACFLGTSNTFTANAGIFGKVYFPRLVTPLATILSNLVRFGIQFLLLMAAITWYSFHGHPISISLNWLLIPLLLVILAGIGFGLGIIVSSLTTKYRDFQVLVSFGMQLLMYGTPVVYPMSYLMSIKLNMVWMISYNPLAPLMEAFRYTLFGKGMISTPMLLYSIAFMLVTMFFGLILFNKVEKSFMDTV